MTPTASPRHPAVEATLVPTITSRLDLAVAGGLGVWAVAEVVAGPGLELAPLAFALASTLPLALRRRFPAAVLLGIAGVLVLQALAGGSPATATPFPSLLLMSFTVAAQIRSTGWALVLGLVPLASMGAASYLGYFGPDGRSLRALAILVFFVGGAWVGGRVVRSRAMAAIAAEGRAEASAAAAVAAERARIAHELHDVVAHAVSVVVLQTGAAEQLLDSQPERARQHIADARRTAAGAMTEMRRLLQVLQDTAAGYAPQPGLAEISDLVEETRRAGHRVELRLAADPELVGEGPALAVYRVVQEALTNVRKHAPGADIRVDVTAAARTLDVEVVNGPGGTTGATGLDGGAGLIGMGERVRVYDGRLEAGEVAGGGWRVHVRLPLSERSEAVA